MKFSVIGDDNYDFLKIFNSLNDMFDKDEADESDSKKRRCGKIKYNSSGNILYNLSLTP